VTVDELTRGMLRRRVVSVVLTITLLASCGGRHDIAYAEPDSGPVARVRFINYTNAAASGFRQYEETDCERGEREVARFGNGRNPDHKRIGIAGSPADVPEGQQTELRVRGGAPFYGVYWSSAPTSVLRAVLPGPPTTPLRCAVAFEFLPDSDRDYQVSFHSDVYRQSCIAILTTINEQGVLTASRDIGMPTGWCRQARAKFDSN
jgi:hypothetical protein